MCHCSGNSSRGSYRKCIMKSGLVLLFILGSMNSAHASIGLYDEEGSLMAKVLKLVGVPASLVVDEESVLYSMGKTDCKRVDHGADGLSSFQCSSANSEIQFGDDLASMLLFNGLLEAGVPATSVAEGTTQVHIKSIKCTVYLGNGAYCQIQTEAAGANASQDEESGEAEG
jgi:hypothetical protein